jgi:hypothetical protein
MSAKEGEGWTGLLAAGGGVLKRCFGAFADGGLVWCRGEQARAAAAAIPSSRHGRGQSEQKRQRGMGAGGLQSTWDKPVPLLRTASLQSFQILDLARFCPEGVRRNARKNSKFEFSKISNWVDQYIG